MNTYTEIDTELLLLAASNSDRDHQEVADRLCDMTPEELRVFCARRSRVLTGCSTHSHSTGI